jgi:hypothetical protein
MEYYALQAGGRRFDSYIAHTENEALTEVFRVGAFFICKLFANRSSHYSTLLITYGDKKKQPPDVSRCIAPIGATAC